MRLPCVALLLLVPPAALPAAAVPVRSLSVQPAAVSLAGASSRQQLVATLDAGRPRDVTASATYRVDDPAVARVSPTGVVTPAGTGETTLVVAAEGVEARVRVTVRDGRVHPTPTFERDVQPILARTGCNAGACHGKARGQNGFQLSLLGFDNDFDFNALANDARGRRLFPAAPDRSLLLTKAAAQVPHGGGRRLSPGDGMYDTLLRWVEAGSPRSPASTPTVERITVFPGERLLAPRSSQQLAVTAWYTDGTSEDVTHLATFQSNESVVASVDAGGRIAAGPLPGEAAVMARFMEKFAVCSVLLPLPEAVDATVYAKLPRNNFIDGHVYAKLARLNLTPSPPADDATFLRRAHLDAIGRLPTPDEVRSFLDDPSADKRVKLVDRLLDRPEYADYWANKWADLLRPNPYRVGMKAVHTLDGWLRESFRENKPYDRFVREILAARGSTFKNGPAVIFRDRRDPAELTTMLSQLFLGIRLDCAKCHHHPFEVYGQDHFYRFAAFFAKVGRKGVGLSPPISGGEEVVYPGESGVVKHPLTDKVMTAAPLFGTMPDTASRDVREALADWVLAPENPYFARVIVNRLWTDLMGRGLVEPVDDLRATNPASNPDLLDALAADLRANKYDLKKTLRRIMTSHVYGLSSLPAGRNAADTRNHSRHYRQRLRAEVLLDAVGDVTGIDESFSAAPVGTRAMQLWTVRTQSTFLDSFGRPDPNQDPPCERTADTTVVQVLHLMNAPGVHAKVTHDEGLPARLAKSVKTDAEVVEEMYLRAYGRRPDAEERKICAAAFADKKRSRRQAAEDVLWALVNTPEFVFKN